MSDLADKCVWNYTIICPSGNDYEYHHDGDGAWMRSDRVNKTQPDKRG